MALSGTLETFSLPDVLRLLSSTKKTGLLALHGDRGRGRVWVRDGAIVAADTDRAVNEQVDGVAFELLRFAEASFEFESGAAAPVDGAPHEVDEVLAEAELRLAEWRAIEAVVPSLDVWVRMVDELDADRTVTTDQWRVLAQVGTGAAGQVLADRLGEGEYDVCRRLRDLVEDGMVELGEVPAAPAAAGRAVDVDAAWDAPIEPSFVDSALDPDAVSSLGADLASFVAAGTVDEPPVAVDFSEPDAFEVVVDTDQDAPEDADDAEDGDLLSELSQLSPKAAAAVEATWDEETDLEEVDVEEAALEEPDAEEPDAEEADAEPVEAAAPPAGDDIDQNLLLRFLSSAKG